MKVCVHSLGCKVNQYEGQAVIDEFVRRGVEAVSDLVPADCYVFNTCSVTAEADKKSRQLTAKAVKLNPNAAVYIIGCSSQNNPAPYKDRKNVRFIAGTAGKKQLVDRIMSDIVRKTPTVTCIAALPDTYEEWKVFGHERARAYIKIQDGCNNFCSYCIVPYLRGRSRSRALPDILTEAENASKTTGEIVFTGINLSAYGRDVGCDLTGLIARLSVIPVRKRLGSLECSVIDEAFLEAMRAAGFCAHFHLSLQSGSDSVLRRMNRRYTTAEFLHKVELIRQYFPDAGLTTDVIAGFPQETEAEHGETLDFLRRVQFSDMHVFPYSERKGTKAAAMPQVEKSVRNARAAEITALKQECRKRFLTSLLGRTMPVYWEESVNGLTQGYTENYVKVYAAGTPGKTQDVTLKELYKDGIKGETV